MSQHLPIDEICASADFSFNVNSGSPVAATLYIIPEDEDKLVRWGAPFTITFKYTEGKPAVTNSPFEVNVTIGSRDLADMNLPLPTVILVTPSSPVVTGSPEDEKTGVVALMAPPEPQGDSPSQRDMNLLDYNIDISMYQPEYGEVESGTTMHTGPDADVPNIRSSQSGETIEIAWDAPVDDQDNEIDVDVDLSVEANGETVSERRESILESYETSKRISIALDYLDELLTTDFERGQSATITVTLTPQQGISSTIVFYWPPRSGGLIPRLTRFEAEPGDTEIDLIWRIGTGPGIASVRYRYRPIGATSWLAFPWNTIDGHSNGTTVTGLINEVDYEFEAQVNGINGLRSPTYGVEATPTAGE